VSRFQDLRLVSDALTPAERVLGPDDEIDSADVLTGFRCRVAEFFE
jgi:hypothetical protein